MLLSANLEDYISPFQFNFGPQQWTAVEGETCSRNILPGQRSNKKTKEIPFSLLYKINPIDERKFGSSDLSGLIGYTRLSVDRDKPKNSDFELFGGFKHGLGLVNNKF